MKEYDYENFIEFMRHFTAIDAYENLDKTVQIIRDLEEIDNSVNSITGCNQAISMLESIGVKTY